MLLCLLFAHIENAKKPGSYEEELNTMLEGNKLPKIKVPKIPNARELVNIPEVMTSIIKTHNTHKTQNLPQEQQTNDNDNSEQDTDNESEGQTEEEECEVEIESEIEKTQTTNDDEINPTNTNNTPTSNNNSFPSTSTNTSSGTNTNKITTPLLSKIIIAQ